MKATIVLAGVAALLTGCGSGGDPDLSPAAAEGRSIAESAGCASCHGADGEGVVGPPWRGLHGSTVILEDGSQVVADDEYLIRSIKDPQADVAEGYPTRMPENTLDDDEIGSILAYIKELG